MAPGKSRIAREHLGDTYFNMRQSGAWISYLPPVSSQAWRIIHNPQREEEIIANQTNFARKAEASGCMGLHFEANEMTVEDYDNELGLQQQRQSKAPSYDADDAALDQAFEYDSALQDHLRSKFGNVSVSSGRGRNEEFISSARHILRLMVHGVQEQATAGAIVNKLVNGTEEPIQASTQISQRSCSLLPSFHTTVSPSSKAHDGVTKIQIPFHIQRITDPIVSPPRSPVLDSPTTTCAPTTSEPISSEPSMPRKKKKKSKKKKLAKKSGPSPTCPILPSTEESTGKVSTLSSPASTCTAVYLGKFSPNDVALRPAEELAAENHPQEVIASDIERPDSPPSPARHAGSDRSSPQLSSTPPETEPELSATVPATPDNVPEVSPKDSFNPTTISWSSFEDQPNFYSWWNIHQHDREHLYWIHEDWSTVKVDISTLNREDDPSACYFCTECRQHSPDKLCWCPKCQKRIRWCCCLHYPSYCNYPGQKAAYQRYLRQFALDAETGFPGTPVSKTEKAPKSPDETEEAPSVSPDQVDTSTPAAPGVSEADEATKTPDKREEKEEAIRSPDERGEAPAVPASPAGTPPAAPAETELISPEPKKRRRKQWPRRKRKKIKFKKNQMTWSDDTSSPGPSPPQDPSPSQGMAVETLSLKHIPELTPTSSLSSTAWDAPKLFTPIGGVSGAVKEPDFLWEFTKDSSFVWKRKHPRVVRRMSWPVNHLGIDEKFVNSV